VELRRVQTQRQAAATQLCALRGQIEPHFLFNTLATVRRLHQTDPAQGAPLLGHFISYLRSTQPDASAGGTLAEELALTSAYLGIIAARMSGRLQVEYEIQEDVRQTPFPPLTIATLVENAVKHGIAPVPEGGTICVSVKAVSGSLEAVVSDTGAGFVGTSGTGIGLANIRARLHTLYGSAGTLSLRANTPRGVRAAIRIPLASEAAA
jgi:LytS/YehU family sensor histidine kinase